MSGLSRYYLSRAVIAAVLGLFLFIGGLPWWMALLTTALVLVLFIWLPRSGRYVVKPGAGATPLRRDERSQRISDRAGSIAFAIVMLATGTLAIYFSQIRHADVPVNWLSLAIVLGALSYFVADFWMQRK